MAQKIILGITQGDTNGVGYEVIIKALSDARVQDMCIPVLYGSSRFFGMYRNEIPETEQIVTNVINSAADARPKRVNIINAVPDNLAVETGQPSIDGAKAAKAAIEAATADLVAGRIDALVTAPINKHTMQEVGFGFTGHTEYLINATGAKQGLMFLCSQHLKVGIVTNHLPVTKVAGAITKELIIEKLRVMNKSLIRDFSVVRPKIAVLGLNPHAGDEGSLGTEERDIIAPAIADAKSEGILAFGPYPADAYFGTGLSGKFDAVLAMYHDQGMIPFKASSFDDGVNFTAGLPVVRTSPDHGTAFAIAGKNMAHPGSVLSAIFCAIDICNNRRRYDEMTADPMEVKVFEGSKYEKTIAPE